MTGARHWVTAIAILCAGFANVTVAQVPAGAPYLAVQGHAEQKVRPDRFPVTITISDTGMDGAKSQALVEKLADLIVAKAESLGVPDADMKIGNLSISPDNDYDEAKDKEIFKGNEYEREITLTFGELDKLKALIASLPESRNLKIETKDFEYSGAQVLRRKLRRDAIDDAKRSALEMASAVGKKLGTVFNVSDRAQTSNYSALGYRSAGVGGPSLGMVSVDGALLHSRIVLREGEILVSADAFLVYLISD